MASRLDIGKYRDVDESSEVSSASRRPVSEHQFAPQPTQRPRVTPAVVDEAVNRVLSEVDYPEETKYLMRQLLATDQNAGFASNYFLGRSEKKYPSAHPSLERRTVYITLVHTPEETSELIQYAPEFELKFTDEDSQDHALAASMRKLDHQLLLAMVPRGIALKDVGGNPIFHIRAALPNTHVCTPALDRKDPARYTTRRMQAAKVLRTSSYGDVSKDLAARYLAGDPTFCCGKLAQECRHPAKVTMSCHVYDVKMEDWPRIMKAAGASMHVGCVIFPTEAFSRTSGTLKHSRARYEVDVDRNEIRMGFEGAASWWYSHTWLDFMRYGADQLIDYEGERFSYKIIEKRGDTVFFQILRVAGGVSLGRQWYRVPGVKMVRVQGFELTQGKNHNSAAGRAPLKPKIHWFPAALWEDMLRHAEMEFERGQMSFDKLYNYYRTVSPRNTVNGVLISGGQRVAHDEMVALVVHVGMVAATTVMLGQRTSRALTDAEMRRRIRATSGRFMTFLRTFWDTVTTFVDVVTYGPLRWIVNGLASCAEDKLLDALVTWAYEPDVVEVPFSSVVGSAFMNRVVKWRYYDDRAEEDLRGHYLKSEEPDHLRAIQRAPAVAKLVTELCADALSADELETMHKAASTVGATTATAVEHDAPSAHKDVPRPDEAVQSARRNAIKECIEESELEERSLDNRCEEIFRGCTDGASEPLEMVIRKRAEEYGQPDFWYVRNSVLTTSLLGVEPAECRYSAVFSLVPGDNGTRFRTLLDATYEPMAGGSGEVKDYKVIAGEKFTGWVMTVDRLQIYNGPEIRETLQMAINLEHTYTVILEQGPPGCGKTYSLLQGMSREDAGMCPVRESALDTRGRMAEKDPGFPDLKLRIRTVDSYLVNYSVEATRQLRAVTLRADEAFMTHSGKWYACAALLGVKEIYAYGDKEQIPHIPRVQAPKFYVRLKADLEFEKFITRRCPADAVAAWGEVYQWRVRTTSSVRHSMTAHTDVRGLEPPFGCVMLCMYQADKKELHRMFAQVKRVKRIQIMTTHEAEGKTFKDVWLFRFDTRPRTDKTSLFDQVPHCLVAMSRHTDTFKYIRPMKVNDQVDKWMENALNLRRVAAAADVGTEGKSMEFL